MLEGNLAELPDLYKRFRKSALVSRAMQAEGWYFGLNGKDRYVLFDAAPILDSKGEIVAAMETMLDITELTQLEIALHESQERLRTIIDTEPQCVKLMAADGALIEMNAAGLAMVEAESFEQVRGKSIYPFVTDASRPAFQDHVARVFNGASEQLTFELIGLKGSHRWLETHSVPFRNSKGEIIALLGITRDISEHRRLEEQLRHSQKLEGIGQLAGGIAHDFNNILTTIIGYGGLMKRQDRTNPYLDAILQASERAANLTRQLLTFSRKQPVNLELIDVNELTLGFEKFLLRVLREDIDLRLDCADTPLPVMADSGQLEQVLMNLVTNARDAMPKGGRLTIRTALMKLDEEFIRGHGFGETGDYAVVSVADTGTGIEESLKERLFEPFFTTKEPGKGTGLGLSMVYGIVRQHNGYIDVESEPGHGAAFNIYLRIAGDLAAQEETRPTEGDHIEGGSETILIAEDSDDLRRMVKIVLEQFGYQVIESIDGQDAIEKFIENMEKIKLVLLDGIMPRKNGMEAYENIKTISPQIRVIFMSGYSEDLFSRQWVNESGAYFMQKPITPTDLLRKVREVLDRKQEQVSPGTGRKP